MDNQRQEATLHDVARAVGVSTRTVSRVVNDEGGFSAATRERVMEAVRALGYRPNLLARGLIQGRSTTIGLVATNMTDPFFPDVAEGVQAAARDVGLTMFFSSTGGDAERQDEVINSLRSHAVDGIIIFPAPGTVNGITSFASSNRVPTVIVDDHAVGPFVRCVQSDIAAGTAMALEHLRGIGRERIAMLGSDQSVSKTREAGYVAAIDHEPIAELRTPTADGGRAAMEAILQRAPDIDAVFAYNDLMAMAALGVLAEAGRSVPDDIAVVGFDNIEVSALARPALTTVHMDRDRLGHEALAALLSLRDAPDEEHPPVTVPVTLVRRESA